MVAHPRLRTGSPRDGGGDGVTLRRPRLLRCSQAGGTTICRLAQSNMAAETAYLPFRKDWDTNCAPYESFLGE